MPQHPLHTGAPFSHSRTRPCCRVTAETYHSCWGCPQPCESTLRLSFPSTLLEGSGARPRSYSTPGGETARAFRCVSLPRLEYKKGKFSGDTAVLDTGRCFASIDTAGDHQGLCWRMPLGLQSRARVPARGTPTMIRMRLPGRVMGGAGLAPALAFSSIRLSIALTNNE